MLFRSREFTELGRLLKVPRNERKKFHLTTLPSFRCQGLFYSILGVGICFASFSSVAVFAADEKVRVVPHRAFYTLQADKIEERSGVKASSGRMVIEITGSSCEGWAVNVLFANAFTVQRARRGCSIMWILTLNREMVHL